MNILILNDDGPQAYGLSILLSALRSKFKNSKLKVMVPERIRSGASASIDVEEHVAFEADPSLRQEIIKTAELQIYTFPLTPMSILDHAFMNRHLYLSPKESWDLVVAGVNFGPNLGRDILTSGTVMAPLMAATFYGVPAFAFSQELSRLDLLNKKPHPTVDKDDDPDLFERQINFFQKEFQNSLTYLPYFLNHTRPEAGICYNVNFPSHQRHVTDFATTSPAHYSYVRTPDTSIVPRARKEQSDIRAIQQGFVTVTEMVLSCHR